MNGCNATAAPASIRHPKVAAIILVWNEVNDTKRCVASLLASDYANLEILLVDNGSREGIVSGLREFCKGVEILELGANLGFSAGNNAGIDHAMRRGADYVFLLNQDTMVEPSTVSRLMDFAKEHPEAGIIGPSVLCSPDEDLVYAAGGWIHWGSGITRNDGMFVAADVFDGLNIPRAVDFVPGCGMLVSRHFLETVGGLDAEYFFNFEEVEWAVRGHRAGFVSWCVPQSRMWHRISASLGSSSPANTYYMTRNALRFFWLNGSRFERWAAVGRILLRTCRTMMAWTVKSTYRSDEYRRKRLANLMAIRDFLFGRYGKMKPDVARVCQLVH